MREVYLLFALMVADGLATAIGISLGAREVNPLWAGALIVGTGHFLLLKVALSTVVTTLSRFRLAHLSLLVLFYALVVFWDLFIIGYLILR